MDAYERGFVDKCAELGVDPVSVMDYAEKLAWTQPQPAIGAAPAVSKTVTGAPAVPTPKVPTPPALYAKAPAVGTAAAANAQASTGRRKITWDEVRRGVRDAPRDPESCPMRFEPRNFWKNLRGGARKAFGF